MDEEGQLRAALAEFAAACEALIQANAADPEEIDRLLAAAEARLAVARMRLDVLRKRQA